MASDDCDMLSDEEPCMKPHVFNLFGDGHHCSSFGPGSLGSSKGKITVSLPEKDDDNDEEESLLHLDKLFSVLIISRVIRFLSSSTLLLSQYIVCGTGDSIFNLQAVSTQEIISVSIPPCSRVEDTDSFIIFSTFTLYLVLLSDKQFLL
jgi:hypothetical protein